MRKYYVKATDKSQDSINIDKLWSLIGEEKMKEAKDQNKAVFIDVVERVRIFCSVAVDGGRACSAVGLHFCALLLIQQGYDKVLGNGNLPDVPLVVRARFFSKRAENKIRAAGGICQLRA